MTKLANKSEQRGTLLIEALAMLGLIAMVTPTLYKKSAERLQEIQDINAASQARTMSNVMDAYIQANFSPLMSAMSSDVSTVIIDYEDKKTGAFDIGYSSYLPYGYKPDEIKNYGAPKVYVHRDKDTLVSYVVYPRTIDPGKKRAARLASLVGANGGLISENKEALGTGGAWYLDSSMVEDLDFDAGVLEENSLIVTSNEPISMSYDDSAKYLYRVPPNNSVDADSEYYHNTMVTDLYMGGHDDVTDFAYLGHDYYSIFNVRKMTMNTDCNRQYIHTGTKSSSLTCDPNVADLYIGKPIARTLKAMEEGYDKAIEANNGAAWIYGNLSALSENFRLFREGGGTDGYDTEMNRVNDGYDVLEFARLNGSSGTEGMVVLRAENKKTGEGARVAMMDDFVQVVEGSTKVPEFMVGGSSATMIHAFDNGTKAQVYINQKDFSSETYINKSGGIVEINSGSSNVPNKTYVNFQGGGNLYMGKDAGWMQAEGIDNSSRVYLLKQVAGTATDNRIFAVGHESETENHMIYGNKDKVSIRRGNIRAYTDAYYTGAENIGGRGSTIVRDYGTIPADLRGLTTMASRYTDILGATYMGAKTMMSSSVNDGMYTRNEFTLGVAGSAWIDDLLWARQAWFKEAGMKELHAGYANFAEFKDSNTRKKAWLNAYDDKVVIRDRAKAHGSTAAHEDDTMFMATSGQVLMSDTEGAWALLDHGSARIGTNKNFFYADENGTDGSANVIGSTLANIYTASAAESSKVNIQRDAMMFGGHWTSSYANTIAAKTGQFTIKTKEGSSNATDDVQFMANKDKIRTRYVDFMVEDNSSTTRFKVMPNVDPDSKSEEATAMVNGSLHVTGNKVIHIASNSSNATGTTGNDHAMFEVDPEYVQVWSKDSAGNYVGGSSGSTYYAMLKINPTDTKGGSTKGVSAAEASVYIRKGAIELEQSYKTSGSSGVAADEGYGYIKANRFVSNTGETAPTAAGKADRGTAYDQYMVNPAYTSVMHDIKLTTRGGARLSDALPDFVLKAVYNVSNDYYEGTRNKRIKWSAGDACGRNGITCPGDNVAWADPFLGNIPYAICPPGYKNMATVIPTSFQMGQAGEVIEANSVTNIAGTHGGKYVINPAPRQAAVLQAAVSQGLIYPGMEAVSSLIYNGIYQDGTTHSSFLAQTLARTEGWYLGLKAVYKDASATITDSEMKADIGGLNVGTYSYTKDGTHWSSVAQPLYFQQNSWLKTALKPRSDKTGWDARMGFIYDRNYYGATLGNAGNEGILSNNSAYGDNSETENPTYRGGDFVWNLFPVPTNTLEGHATVYCYFDRTQFKDGEWSDKVDQIDQLNDYRDINTKKSGSNTNYIDRLNDPSLKYNDPW